MVVFSNVIIREIYTYLGFDEIFASNLYFINKRFYHNFIEDKEVALRLLYPTFNIIDQNDHEINYLSGIKALDEYFDDYMDDDETELLRTYDQMDCKQLIVYIHRILKQTLDFQQFVLAFRTTGGYESEYHPMTNTFDSQPCY